MTSGDPRQIPTGQIVRDGRVIDCDDVAWPAHYNQGDIECVDASRESLTPEEFRGSCKAQAQQYIWRERQKGGDVSLRKAIWWLRMAIGDDPRKDRQAAPVAEHESASSWECVGCGRTVVRGRLDCPRVNCPSRRPVTRETNLTE